MARQALAVARHPAAYLGHVKLCSLPSDLNQSRANIDGQGNQHGVEEKAQKSVCRAYASHGTTGKAVLVVGNSKIIRMRIVLGKHRLRKKP